MGDDHANIDSIFGSTQFENLPVDAALEILEKLPLTSIARCRLLSKWFPRIMDDQHFASKHFLNAAKNYNPFLFLSRRNSLYFLDLDSVAANSEFKKFDIPFTLPDFFMVGSCNGYLCLSTSSKPGDSRYQTSYPFGSLYDDVTFVWNPFTAHFMELPPSSKCMSWAFGFGFHPLTGQYKIVKMYNDGEHLYFMQILTLGTDNWRTLKTPSNVTSRALLRTKNKGVCVNGSMHWLVKKREEEDVTRMVIMALDLATEELEEIALPKDVDSKCCENLIEIHGCLAMAAVGKDRLEIWVLKRFGSKDSWTLQFVIRNLRERLEERIVMKKNQGEVTSIDDVVCLMKEDKLLIQFKIGGMLCYDFVNEVFTDFKVCGVPNLRGFLYEYEAIALTGSFVHIN